MEKHDIVVTREDRLLKIIEQNLNCYGYNTFLKALRKKDIRVNGQKTTENIVCQVDDKICIFLNERERRNNIKIIYEDDKILVVNKPKNIETSDGDYNVLQQLSNEGYKAYPVHRLDRNTTGLVMFAKDEMILSKLINVFKNKEVEKYYIAEVYGTLSKTEGVFEGFLFKNSKTNLVKISKEYSKGAQKILTSYKVLKTNGVTSLLEIKIVDGKTHQIRAHLAYNNIPIIGDGKYGNYEINKKYNEKTQRLKAYKIKFKITSDNDLKYLNDVNLEIEKMFDK